MPSWKNQIVPINKYIRPGTMLNGVKKVVIHWTSNPGGSAAGHQLYFSEILPAQNTQAVAEGRKPTYASAHLFVDPIEAICIIPLNEVAFHANENYTYVNGVPYRGVDALKPNANLLSVSVEMCVEKDNTISVKIINRSMIVIKDLCTMFKLTEKDIVRHFDVTRKPCPYPFVKDRALFENFKHRVGFLLRNKDKYPGYLIKKGSRGDYVIMIQEKLNVSLTGYFGALTELAVRNFQKNQGLKSDGIVGEKTWNQLFK